MGKYKKLLGGTEDIIARIISGVIDESIKDVKDTYVLNDMGICVFDMLDIVTKIEDKFMLAVRHEDYIIWKTIGDIARYCSRGVSHG